MAQLTNRETQEQYEYGYIDKRRHLGKTMFARGLQAAERQAKSEQYRLERIDGPYIIGMRHAIDDWLQQSRGV